MRVVMVRRPSFLVTLVVLLAACSASHASFDPASGGTPAPDDAPGFCCPARTGGCALSGGYRESGTCPKDFDICDNMCEQRIVKDEHGCDKLTYKIPEVSTTYAGTASCSAPVFHGGEEGEERDDGGDGGEVADSGDGGDGG